MGSFFTKTQLWLILSSVRLFLGQYPAQDKLISFPGCRIAQVFVECKGPGDRNPSLFHPETWEKWSSPGFLLLQCSPKFPSYFFFFSMFYGANVFWNSYFHFILFLFLTIPKLVKIPNFSKVLHPTFLFVLWNSSFFQCSSSHFSNVLRNKGEVAALCRPAHWVSLQRRKNFVFRSAILTKDNWWPRIWKWGLTIYN